MRLIGHFRRPIGRTLSLAINTGLSQFTSEAFTELLKQHGVLIRISMDGKGQYKDNIFVDRLWRTMRYEEVYLKAYRDGRDARNGLREHFRFYNNRRPHQARVIEPRLRCLPQGQWKLPMEVW